MLVVTAASGVALVAVGSLALSLDREFRKMYDDEEGYERRLDTGNALSRTGDVLIGVTAASAVTTLVLAFYTRWRSVNDHQRSSLVPAVTAGRRLGFSWRF